MEGFFKTFFEWALAGDRVVWLLVAVQAVVIWKMYMQGRTDLISGLKAREKMATEQLEAINNSKDAIEDMRKAVESLSNLVTLALNLRGRV